MVYNINIYTLKFSQPKRHESKGNAIARGSRRDAQVSPPGRILMNLPPFLVHTVFRRAAKLTRVAGHVSRDASVCCCTLWRSRVVWLVMQITLSRVHIYAYLHIHHVQRCIVDVSVSQWAADLLL